jgi:hypothetical protein
MPLTVDLTGRQFGRWTALHLLAPRKRSTMWMCMCNCPLRTQKAVSATSLVTGNSKSCGCLRSEVSTAMGPSREKHGFCKFKEYPVWKAMHDRCENPRNKRYADYGGKGIKVCDRWADFTLFLQDLGSRPGLRYSLDRWPNRDGNYEPGNVRWATDREQQNNRNNNRILTLHGRSQTLAEWSRELNISQRTLRTRLRSGWGDERVLLTPIKLMRNHPRHKSKSSGVAS